MTDPKVIRMRLHPAGEDNPEEGDVLVERGPKIGERLWRCVLVERKRTLLHAVVIPADHCEPGDTWWELVRP